MSLFTKIFVVLNMVVSVLLVGLVVAYATNENKYKEKYDEARSQAETFKLEAKNREAESLAAYHAATASIEQLQTENETLRGQMNQKDTLQIQLQSEIAELTAHNARFRSELSKLAGGAEQDSKILAQLYDEAIRRRDSESKLSAQLLELSVNFNEKVTENDRLNQQLRLFQEENTDLKRQNRDLAQRIDSVAGLAMKEGGPLGPLSRGTQPDRPIRGMVTGLQQIGDQTFIQINVGRNDGVQEGMQFTIHKGEAFLGTAIIKLVDLNESGAQVTLLKGTIVPSESEAYTGPEN